MSNTLKYYKVKLEKADCSLDITDGSERGEYVNQDYILTILGKPHRSVNLMYTYYPKDELWSDKRISETCKNMEVSFQWDYPYDDYFPYGGGIGGNTEGEPFCFMRDIRRHGQDVTLTLTIDCSLEDEYLIKIAEDLRPFGRLKLRINHECAGTWFAHNKRFSHKEIADFFCRFCNILHKYAPNVKTIFCAGFSKKIDEAVEFEEDFLEAYKAADVWSGDAYLSLHYGWPYDVAESDRGNYSISNVSENFKLFKYTADRLTEICGERKPMTSAELNADGDVTGAKSQSESVKEFYSLVKEQGAGWFESVAFYQFRDKGRLGLEIQDPNNPKVGIPQPILADYKQIMSEEFFSPKFNKGREASFPCKLRWGSAEDSEGIEVEAAFDKSPEFCEITVEQPLSLMIEVNGKWFYKSPEVKNVDLMSAFFTDNFADPKTIPIRIFATPPTGENPRTNRPDWPENYYAEMFEPPKFRIRYEAPIKNNH